MRIDDVTLKEAPVGMLKKAGQAAGARALGAIGMKGKAGNLAGKADLSDTANNLYNEFRRYLGTQDKDIKTATGEDLSGFLNSKGVKVPGIPSGVVNKNIINKIEYIRVITLFLFLLSLTKVLSSRSEISLSPTTG